MPVPKPWIALVLFSLVLQTLLWRTSTRLDATNLVRRDAVEDEGPGTLLGIDYSDWYFGSPKAHRPALFVALVLWAGFLFSTIGITASDFFCPNLATVADRLGLGESTAGVTFLAFGNGSPDVFSTFSALKSNTFALAIGELLGASAFITSIVVGSMALIQPFHVPRWPFLRDVGFFTVAVTILVACLKDGKLTLLETGGLVFLYVLYVGIVIGGNWWHSRRKSVQERQGKGISLPEEQGELTAETRPSQDDLLKPTDALLASRSRSSSVTSNLSLPGTPNTLSHQSTGTLTPHRPLHRPPIDAPRPTFSLLGAIEFRDAINALRKESAAAAAAEQGRQLVDDHEAQLSGQLDDLLGEPSIMADYFGPSSPFPSGHYHSHGHHLPHGRASSRPGTSRQPSSTGRMGRDVSTPGALVGLKPDAVRVESTPLLAVSDAGRTRQARTISDVRRSSADAIHTLRHFPGKDALPEPTVQDAVSPTTGSISDVEHDAIPLTSSATAPAAGPSARARTRWTHILRQILHTLFPALQEFRQKSISGKILGIFASPAILALTVTLPVVDDSAEGLSLEQGGAIRLDNDAGAGDAPYQGQNEAEHGIVNHSNDADAEDEQQVMGLAGHDLHRRLLGPGNMSPGGSPVLQASHGKYDQDAQEECAESDTGDVLLFNKYLTATQAVLGTLFCSCVIFSENAAGKYIIPALTGAGACLGLAILFTARDGRDPTWRLIRCFAGFFSAMLWIAAIADEVVEILQTFGKILGLSNAIIGLTVFAIGNSCADLISCLTIASFAPNMSYAACFGGPMLNILLGIGGAGTYVILSTGHSYPVHFSPTLWVSAIGLICLLCITLVFIPFNNYCISRRWAIFLYGFYITLTIINIVVEIKGIRI